MKVLVINGSPKGKESNTYRLTRAFLEGLGAADIRENTVCKMKIKPCLGCFSCWNKTPGKCVILDEMESVIENLLWADVVIWSFPLYYFSVPGGLKNMMDRQLPMVLPFMVSDSESGSHPSRYTTGRKRHVVISTCGFYTAKGNYDGVTAIFDHLCGKDAYTKIFCGQGELFRVKELRQRTDEYLSYVKQAGLEFVKGEISQGTQEKLDTLLFPRNVFEVMADASWGIEEIAEENDESFSFTKQMAALYNVESYTGKDIILEMYYTDLDKRYQIHMGKEGSRVQADNLQTYTTRIETPFTVWKAIAAGEISGQEALAQQKYRVKGDFDLMIHWDRYFGITSEKSGPANEGLTTNMNCLLFPWITFWIAAAIHGYYGALAAIFVCQIVPLVYHKNRKTLYDMVTSLLVVICAVLVLLGVNTRIVVPLSYLGFGVMWVASCFVRIPLTAHYSMNDYNGEEALNNPLFVKTNRILTACWGVLYLLTPIWTYFLMGTAAASWTGAINSVLPILTGIFTVWFQKWYPAKVASGY